MVEHARHVIVIAMIAVSAMYGTVAAPAQEDQRLTDLLGKIEALRDDNLTAFCRIHERVLVNGQDQGERIEEMWLRGLDRLRMEEDDGSIITLTPDEVKLYHAPSRVMMHIASTTLEALGDDRSRSLRKLGVPLPSMIFDGLIECKDQMAITAEDVIGEEECWVLTSAEETFPTWMPMVHGVPDEFRLIAAQVALEKGAANFRGISAAFEGRMHLEVYLTIPEMEEGIEVADEMFAFEPPDDITIITWSLDKTPGEVGSEFQAAVNRAM